MELVLSLALFLRLFRLPAPQQTCAAGEGGAGGAEPEGERRLWRQAETAGAPGMGRGGDEGEHTLTSRVFNGDFVHTGAHIAAQRIQCNDGCLWIRNFFFAAVVVIFIIIIQSSSYYP